VPFLQAGMIITEASGFGKDKSVAFYRFVPASDPSKVYFFGIIDLALRRLQSKLIEPYHWFDTLNLFPHLE
jgi:hypothetical protein